MQDFGVAVLCPIILIAGALQAWGPPMNGALRNSLNPWLASLISFLPVVALLAVLVMCLPRPLPTADGVSTMPWWAPLGGLIGAFAVIAGLLFVDKVGAGAFAGLTITANILTSLAIDHFGWFGIDVHPLNGWRMLGALLMVTGVALVARFRAKLCPVAVTSGLTDRPSRWHLHLNYQTSQRKAAAKASGE
jgi:bacterial/archaeal transporter family-2 protein